MSPPTFRDPVRNVNPAILSQLEVLSNKVGPLAGGRMRRPSGGPDPRLSQLQPLAGFPLRDEIDIYLHLATLRLNSKPPEHYVVFRQTMDALLLEQTDPEKFPEWLMKDQRKKAELQIYIYRVKKHWKQVPNLSTHEDWLEPIHDPSVFDSVVYFLLHNKVIDQNMYERLI